MSFYILKLLCLFEVPRKYIKIDEAAASSQTANWDKVIDPRTVSKKYISQSSIKERRKR